MTATPAPTRMHVNESRCQGHGRCYSISAELFAPDEEGFGVALSVDITDDNLGIARRAIGECPEQAVEIIDQQRREGK